MNIAKLICLIDDNQTAAALQIVCEEIAKEKRKKDKTEKIYNVIYKMSKKEGFFCCPIDDKFLFTDGYKMCLSADNFGFLVEPEKTKILEPYTTKFLQSGTTVTIDIDALKAHNKKVKELDKNTQKKVAFVVDDYMHLNGVQLQEMLTITKATTITYFSPLEPIFIGGSNYNLLMPLRPKHTITL